MEFNENRSDLDTFNYINSLCKQGIQIYRDGDKLKYKAVGLHLDEAVMNEIRLRKEELLKYLEEVDSTKINLSPLQLAYMTGQSSVRSLNLVNAHYYMEYTKKSIDLNKLEDCLNVIIENNDALRLVILTEGKALIFRHVPRYKIESYVDSSEETKLFYRAHLSRKKYEPETWPMFTFLVGKGLESDILHISFDCSILDAWSSANMIRMLFNMYNDKPVSFSKYSYKEYVNELEAYKQRKTNRLLLEEAGRYWSKAVQVMPQSPRFPMKTGLDQVKEITFERKEYQFSREVTERFTKLAASFAVTFTSVLMTIYMEILSGLCGYRNIAVNTTLFGKLPLVKGLEDLLGEFTNIGLVKYVKDDQPFIDKIKNTQEQILYLLKYRLYDGINITNKLYHMDDHYQGHLFVVTCMVGETYHSKDDDFLETYSISQTPQVLVDHHIRLIDGRIKISFDSVKELIDDQDITTIIEQYISRVTQFCKIQEIERGK